MSMLQRVQNVLAGLLMIAGSVVMILSPDDGCAVIAWSLSILMILAGIRSFFYYFTMARHMVGGEMLLYTGAIVFDFGMLTNAVSDSPKLFVIFYLLLIHAFSGLVDILRGLEAKRLEAPSWRLATIRGIINLLTIVFCVIFVRSTQVLVGIYCLGLIYSACTRIYSAFRKTAMVYIPR
ncbi:MAG: hypothetical protein IJ682_09520 [Lachnospiraceae bacterium]|nr:hypothetical protein [Lachnospiraceae bacterium]